MGDSGICDGLVVGVGVKIKKKSFGCACDGELRESMAKVTRLDKAGG